MFPVIKISYTLMNVLQCDLFTPQPLPILRHDLERRPRSQQAGSVARQASSDTKLPDVGEPVQQAAASKPTASDSKLPTIDRGAVTRKPATPKPSAASVELPAVEQEARVPSSIPRIVGALRPAVGSPRPMPACVAGEFSRRYPKLKLKKPGHDILDGLCKGVSGGQVITYICQNILYWIFC